MRGVAAACLVAACSGCAVGPDFKRPELPPGADYAPSPVARAGPPPAEWWSTFGSTGIDALVRDALARSPDLAAAHAALKASEESLAAGAGVYYPQVDIGASALRERLSPFRLGVEGTVAAFNLITLGAAVSYAIDVFGGNRRAVEKLGAETDYERALGDATFLTLTGNVVNTAIAGSAYREELRATEALLALQRREARLYEAQWQAGVAPYASVLAARQQVASTRAALPALRQRIAAANDLLATLSGRTPAEWSAAMPAFDEIRLPEAIPLSLPSALVRQRPDILEAEAALHAASAQVGIATAALYPTVTLDATAGVQGPDRASLGTEGARYGSFGPSINIPVFSGFSGVHGEEAAKQQYEQAFAQYRQTVANAFGQVATALQALDNDAQAERAQGDAFAIASRGRELAAANAGAGLASELQENLSAQSLEIARINLLQARAQHLQDAAALYVALGRPWTGAEGERPR
ncbi:MAG TPA: efflux transporter outer membrane subunit [Usitatibacter sp.]|nr:efflux transporter outer membrane subunit [Usitatibacter sp.]